MAGHGHSSSLTTLSSAELNLVVFRYLQESGFTHSAFAMGYEAGINKSPINGDLIPPGALIKFVQKGLQYLEMEANLTTNNADVEEDFSFIQPMDLITKSVNELQHMVKVKRGNAKKEKRPEREPAQKHKRLRDRKIPEEKDTDRARKEKKLRPEAASNTRAANSKAGVSAAKKDGALAAENVESAVLRECIPVNTSVAAPSVHTSVAAPPENTAVAAQPVNSSVATQLVNTSVAEPVNTSVATQLVNTSVSTQPMHINIPDSDVIVLKGHTSEVCACAWNPATSLLASGSGDKTARIWKIKDELSGSQGGSFDAFILKHDGNMNGKNNDVTTLDWNGEGTLLATGSYDGHARIWMADGGLKTILTRHKGPVFSLKWNKRGDYLLTGSCDKTAVVWDVKSEEPKQQFAFHSDPVLDVDWRNNVSFATGSADKMIYVCKIGESRPIKAFEGHQSEVNCVKWDPTGSVLASCSDDQTVKLWSLKHDSLIHDLKEHSREIYAIRWSPTGPGTSNPNLQLMLASASFDSTVKLWDVESGKLAFSLNGHRDPVYAVAFSPNGEYLASGSLDKSLHIWSLKEGKIVKTYTGSGGIFDVSWNKEGNRLAASFANNNVCVLDVRM